MSQPFSFPPPPPPPPRRQNATNPEPFRDTRGGFRGRSTDRGNFSRGRGNVPRGRGSYGTPNSQRGRGDSSQRPYAPAPKRDYNTAFPSHTQSRSTAHAAVPSFNVDTTSLLSRNAQPATSDVAKKKSNLLGLTPAAGDASESEDDVDEESELAPISTGGELSFEHNGQKLSLNSQVEIAAWIAERRKKFPTKAKVDAAKREAEEKKRRWEEQKKARDEAMRLKREAQAQERQKARDERERKKLKDQLLAVQVAKAKSALAETKADPAEKARQRAEKLKRKAEKAAQELQKLEEQLRQADQTNVDSGEQKDFEAQGDVMEGEAEESIDSESEDTSSSGSSDSDTDSGSEPEETTSKRTELDQVAPPKHTKRQDSTDERPFCKSLAKFGRCKFGKRCRFSHKPKKESAKKPPSVPVKRRGLYQVMVEKEREEELQRALQVIVSLGERGLLEEKPDGAAGVETNIAFETATTNNNQ